MDVAQAALGGEPAAARADAGALPDASDPAANAAPLCHGLLSLLLSPASSASSEALPCTEAPEALTAEPTVAPAAAVEG